LVKTIKKTETEAEIEKRLAELRAELHKNQKPKKAEKPKPKKAEKPKPKKAEKPKPKKAEKPKPKKAEKPKPKKAEKPEKIKKERAEKAKKIKKERVEKAKKIKKERAEKAKKIKKEKAEKAKKIKQEKAEKAEKIKQAEAEKIKQEESERTPEEELEEQFSDEQIRNFQIEKMDMDRITNKVCEIVAAYEDKGMLQSDLWKKLKLSNRDGSRLALRLERRGLISREKILQKDRWTYKLIIEQTPISLESLQNSPCLTCPVEQKCDVENVYPEPSPLHCQLIEDWVIAEYSKKKK